MEQCRQCGEAEEDPEELFLDRSHSEGDGAGVRSRRFSGGFYQIVIIVRYSKVDGRFCGSRRTSCNRLEEKVERTQKLKQRAENFFGRLGTVNE